MNLSDKIHEALVSHSTDLQRYSADLQGRIGAMLDRLGRDLAREIADAGLDTPRTDWQRARLQALLNTTQKRIGQVYGEVADLHGAELAAVVEISAKAVAGAVNESAGTALVLAPKWSAQRLAAIADDTLVNGAPSAEWWSRQAGGLSEAFADQMRQGMLRGETIQQMTWRITGKGAGPKYGPTEGIMQIARRDAEALVRTSTMSVSNAANLAAFEDNSDLIESVQWVATLDIRTCPTCGVLDGRKWGMDDSSHPTPPRHWSCRCMLVPITKSWEQLAREAHGNSRLGRALDEMDGPGRAAMDGRDAQALDYQDWFDKQEAARKLEILGRERMKLLDAGQLRFRDMVDGRGNPMTLEQLQAR